jgi:2-alkyl-3-oxoalkanoate reductase
MVFEEIPSVGSEPFDESGFERIIRMRHSKLGKALLRILPTRLRYAGYQGLSGWFQYPPDSSCASKGPGPPRVADLERTLLQTCSWKLSSEKAERMLGYSPQVSFPEGCHRSVEWLRFAGYPVAYKNE